MQVRAVLVLAALLLAAFGAATVIGCRSSADQANQAAPKTPDEMKAQMKAHGMIGPPAPKAAEGGASPGQKCGGMGQPAPEAPGAPKEPAAAPEGNAGEAASP